MKSVLVIINIDNTISIRSKKYCYRFLHPIAISWCKWDIHMQHYWRYVHSMHRTRNVTCKPFANGARIFDWCIRQIPY